MNLLGSIIIDGKVTGRIARSSWGFTNKSTSVTLLVYLSTESMICSVIDVEVLATNVY